MVSLVDFFNDKNIEIAANRIIFSFSDTSNNYSQTYSQIAQEIASNASKSKNSHYIQLIKDNKIKNLGELTCLYLNTFIGPENTPFRQTRDDFEVTVQRNLRNEGLPEKYISGDNTHLTEQGFSLVAKTEAKFDPDKNPRPFEIIKNKLIGLNKFPAIFLILSLTLSYGVFVFFITTHQSVRNPKSFEKFNPLENPYLLDLHVKAQVGDLKSKYDLGVAYEKGNDIQNFNEALKWYREAAEGDYIAAQYKLGVLYYKGQGVSKNHEEAFKWFQKSARWGHKESQFNLAVLYYNGRGVVEDKERAAYWFLESAQQGNAMAQYNLGLQYLQGQGVVKNEETAEYWMNKSAAQGLAQAQLHLEKKHGR